MPASSNVLIAQERWLVFGRTLPYDTRMRTCLRDWAAPHSGGRGCRQNVLFKKV